MNKIYFQQLCLLTYLQELTVELIKELTKQRQYVIEGSFRSQVEGLDDEDNDNAYSYVKLLIKFDKFVCVAN